MKRLSMFAMFFMMLVPLAVSAVQAQGNSDAAHACQDGGYLELERSEADGGGGFSTVGECVSYAAQGGELVAITDDGGDDGSSDDGDESEITCADYENLAPISNPSVSFWSQEACESYGGVVVAYDPSAPQVFLFDLGEGSGDNCAIGVGLKRFPANATVSISITQSGSDVTGSPFSVTTDGDGDTNPTDVLTNVSPGTYTASATTNGQTYSHTVGIPVSGSSCGA